MNEDIFFNSLRGVGFRIFKLKVGMAYFLDNTAKIGLTNTIIVRGESAVLSRRVLGVEHVV